MIPFLQHLGFEVKQAGSQLQVDCPNCGDEKKHLYIAPGNGLGHCHKCGWSPNPYLLAQKVTGKEPKEIFKILDEYGLNDGDKQKSDVRNQKSEKKELALSKDDIRPLTDEEKQKFCELKQIDLRAFEKFKPYAHKTEPWILLPAFNPAEPNIACGWLRCGLDGQQIQLADGRMEKYPAIAGSRHGLFGLGMILAEKPDTIIFAEGWRDMAACLAIGLHATASSGGASTWKDEWLSVFEGKTVYICMDCDIPGQKAARRAAERIITVAKAVFIVALPYEETEDHGKDTHDYISENGKDFLLLLSRAVAYRPQGVAGKRAGQADGIVLENDHPDTIAEAFEETSKVKHRYNSIDGWSIFWNGKYSHIDDENEIGVCIRRFLKRCYYPKTVGKTTIEVRVKPTNSRIRDIMGALAAVEGVHIRPKLHAPASLTGEYNPKNIIAMGNSLLDISADEPKELPLTDEFYTFNYLPFDYEPEAGCPEWLKFLGEIFTVKTESAEWDAESADFVGKQETAGDEDAISILQEWMGNFISSDTHLQKIFGLIGPRRSGKSTIGKIIRALLGAKNTASPTLTSLATEFGLQPLLNKTMAIIGDANISGRASDVTRAVERLKSISGEDSQQVNRKNKTHIEVDRLSVRFIIIANEMQDLRDSSGALASRFNFLVTTESFLDREDTQLDKKLLKEVPGIFVWALAGLARLRKRGYLLEHSASKESREDFEAMSSPMTAFVNEWCQVGSGNWVPVDALWRAHGDWSKQNGRGDGFSKQKFALKIKSIVPGIAKERRRLDLSILEIDYGMDNNSGDNRVHVYEGIGLQEEYKKRPDSVDTQDRGWTP